MTYGGARTQIRTYPRWAGRFSNPELNWPINYSYKIYMLMTSRGWGEMTALAGPGSQSFFANIMRGRMYSPTTLFDDPSDYEAIRRAYGMFGASGREPFHWLANSIYQVARKGPTGCVLVGACR